MLKSTVLIICLYASALMAMPALDESSVKNFIIESSDKFSELYNAMSKRIYDLEDIVSDDGSKESKETKQTSNKSKSSASEDLTSDEALGFFALFLLSIKIVLIREGIDNMTTLAEEAYRFPVDQYTDEEVKLGILKLRTMIGLVILKEDYKEWEKDDLYDFLGNANFCKLEEGKEKCKTKANELTKILKTSTNPTEILHYWKEWREKNLPEARRKMKTFIELYKKLGVKYERGAKFAWFADYLDENFGDEMENVMHELEPLYKELHAYVRYMLHEEYGNIVPVNGLIPHHLYEQAIAQAWTSHSIIAKDFEGVKLPIENNFKEPAKDVLETASKFMKSLGLSDIPEDFWTTQVRELSNKGDDCVTKLYDEGNKTYFGYCSQVNIKRFIQMHGYASRIYYANEHKNLSFAYRDPYNFELATGEAVILSATTPKYLHEIGHKDVSVLPGNEDMNRLYRMGVHTLLSVPEYFVHVKVIADVLDDKVTFDDMNKHYWELMEKYVGVAPPVERAPESIDFPQKFYYKIETNHQATKFVSEIVGYQIYESLCLKSGQFVKDDATHSLHNCNFYNSKEAGQALKNMMQLGNKKPWKQILGTVTGDDSGMKGEAMLEYYEPLQKWLHTKNTARGVKVGW